MTRTFDEDRFHSQHGAEFDVGKGITDHRARCGSGFGKARDGLVEEAGQGLAALALSLIVRTDKESINVGASTVEMLLEGSMNGINIGKGVKAEGNAALVRDHDSP